ncbi:unnamed protein product [Brachionus calyciflorus]|uniref:Uncharacterized protein n=1 Tax=Brachionus calyciflorus TaxID=104777 RepID=A0A813M2V2_9BILA|nr:unnamed protein product [Brachionus calyciflorus]
MGRKNGSCQRLVNVASLEKRTSGFVSITDLAENVLLMNALDESRFKEHTLEARQYSGVEAMVEKEDDGKELRQELEA